MTDGCLKIIELCPMQKMIETSNFLMSILPTKNFLNYIDMGEIVQTRGISVERERREKKRHHQQPRREIPQTKTRRKVTPINVCFHEGESCFILIRIFILSLHYYHYPFSLWLKSMCSLNNNSGIMRKWMQKLLLNAVCVGTFIHEGSCIRHYHPWLQS